VTVEGYNKGAPLDLVKLDGTWRLQYTSAPDVLVLLEAAARVSFFQVSTMSVIWSFLLKDKRFIFLSAKTTQPLILFLLFSLLGCGASIA
jgi:hypothetical protein